MSLASRRSPWPPLLLLVLGLAAAIVSVMAFPEVEGLGSKVRLPVFHGALTWVNLAAFSVMGLTALASAITRRTSWYRWEEALRWISVGIWAVGSGLGFMAAMRTWDFTGSKSSPMAVAAADPRLMAQFWIMLLGLLLIAIELVLADRRFQALFDIAFVAVAWTLLLRAILGPGRALHPDSPVLNSDELGIKLIFFAIVAALGVAVFAVTWLVVRLRASAHKGPQVR